MSLVVPVVLWFALLTKKCSQSTQSEYCNALVTWFRTTYGMTVYVHYALIALTQHEWLSFFNTSKNAHFGNALRNARAKTNAPRNDATRVLQHSDCVANLHFAYNAAFFSGQNRTKAPLFPPISRYMTYVVPCWLLLCSGLEVLWILMRHAKWSFAWCWVFIYGLRNHHWRVRGDKTRQLTSLLTIHIIEHMSRWFTGIKCSTCTSPGELSKDAGFERKHKASSTRIRMGAYGTLWSVKLCSIYYLANAYHSSVTVFPNQLWDTSWDTMSATWLSVLTESTSGS